MRKAFFCMLFAVCVVPTYAQSVDTLTLEKKTRFHINQLKENKIRALTPTAFRKAFNALTNLALMSVIPDTVTHPLYSRKPSEYHEGVSMFQIREAEGWPFDGTLLVEKSSDGYSSQKISNSTVPFPDVRNRGSFYNGGSIDWTSWDTFALTFVYDPPSMDPPSMNYVPYDEIFITVPGLDRYSRVKRMVVDQALPVGFKLESIVPFTADGSLKVYASSDSPVTIDVPPLTITVYITD